MLWSNTHGDVASPPFCMVGIAPHSRVAKSSMVHGAGSSIPPQIPCQMGFKSSEATSPIEWPQCHPEGQAIIKKTKS